MGMFTEQEPVYAVFAKTEMWAQFLGHAAGEVADIAAFYHSQRGYGLIIEPVSVNSIQKGFAKTKAAAMLKKRELQQQLIEIEAKIKEMGG